MTGAATHSSSLTWCSSPPSKISKLCSGPKFKCFRRLISRYNRGTTLPLTWFLLNRRLIGKLWDPGTYHKHPFSKVASSIGNQNPTNFKGSLYRKVPSWWGVTLAPIFGCLKMYMPWTTAGSSSPRSLKKSWKCTRNLSVKFTKLFMLTAQLSLIFH